MQKITVALTGHRPARLAGYQMRDPFYQRLQAALENRITHLLTQQVPVELRSGMALGADTVWAAAALNQRARSQPGAITVVGYVPFPQQAARWPAESQARWRAMTQAMDAVHLTAQSYSPRALMQRNEEMIRGCDLLIALWDGGTSGGTAAAVRYAQRQGVAIERLDPDWFRS